MIRDLPDRRIRHQVLSLGPDTSARENLPEGTPLYSLGIRGRKVTAFFSIMELARRIDAHLLHVNNIGPWMDAVIAARLSARPCIQTFHGVETTGFALGKVRKGLLRGCGRLTDRITAVSDSAAELLNRISGITKIRVIPNGVDTETFSPAASVAEKRRLRQNCLGLDDDWHILGCVAALRPVKNHAGLINAFGRAMADMPGNRKDKTALVLVGDGPLRGQLEQQCRQLGVSGKVHFVGQRSNVPDWLRLMDVFILNSHTEGMSYAVLEAMATGLPIIATDVGANPQLLANGVDGFIVGRGNEEQLADRMHRLTADPSLRATMGIHARKRVKQQFSYQRMLQSYLDLYYSLFDMSATGAFS